MWVPAKAAFRTGADGNVEINGQNFVANETWNPSNMGSLSFATGHGSIASGAYSIAMGLGPQATSFHSVAIGAGVTSSSLYSLALGNGTNATGRYSTAMGHDATASGSEATAIGANTSASGEISLATGEETLASGRRSVSMGFQSIAEGDRSLALGDSTIAMSPNSVSMGNRTISVSHSEVVMGQFNSEYASIGYTGGIWIPEDRLFVLGNGLSQNSRSDAMVVLKNGKTGIGVSNPNVLLEVTGEGDDLGGVSGFDEVSGYFKNENEVSHSAVSIDAEGGQDAILYLSEDSSAIWDLRHDQNANSNFNIRYHGGTGANDTKLSLDVVGNLTIDGTYNPSSDINRKHNISAIDEFDILKKVANLPVSSWSYKKEDITHVGPMAQDFYAAFGLGQGETTIATIDADGIALAAIKALYQKLETQEALISQLQRQLEKLEIRK